MPVTILRILLAFLTPLKKAIVVFVVSFLSRWRCSYINCTFGYSVCLWVITVWCEWGVISCKACLEQVCNLGSLPSVWVEQAKPISSACTYILIRVFVSHDRNYRQEANERKSCVISAFLYPVNEQLLWLYWRSGFYFCPEHCFGLHLLFY